MIMKPSYAKRYFSARTTVPTSQRRLRTTPKITPRMMTTCLKASAADDYFIMKIISSMTAYRRLRRHLTKPRRKPTLKNSCCDIICIENEVSRKREEPHTGRYHALSAWWKIIIPSKHYHIAGISYGRRSLNKQCISKKTSTASSRFEKEATI